MRFEGVLFAPGHSGAPGAVKGNVPDGAVGKSKMSRTAGPTCQRKAKGPARRSAISRRTYQFQIILRRADLLLLSRQTISKYLTAIFVSLLYNEM
jgi:hypothetical protein